MAHHLLVIDDQIDILRILERDLNKSSQYIVHTATNSSGAINMIQKHPIDLVISDVRLAEDNGFVLMNDMKKIRPDLGVMMMTAYRSASYRKQADALGVVFFVEKPFAVKTMVRAVDRYFDQRSSRPLAEPSGDLVNFTLADLVQLFALNGRAVGLDIVFGGSIPRGRVFLNAGRVMHVEFSDCTGEPAFYAMMSQEAKPKISIIDLPADIAESVTASWEQLLLESARLRDEAEERARVIGEPPQATLSTLAPAKATSAAQERLIKGEDSKDDPFSGFWKRARPKIS